MSKQAKAHPSKAVLWSLLTLLLAVTLALGACDGDNEGFDDDNGNGIGIEQRDGADDNDDD